MNVLDRGTAKPPIQTSLLSQVIRLVYPPLCLACGDETESEQGLCGTCWSESHFISGAVCNTCGVPVVGHDPLEDLICDTCTAHPPAWAKGRAVMTYEGAGRRIALSLKHGDRLDIAKSVSHWMIRAGEPVLAECDLLAPVPLHWTRFLKRRYNQASILADHVSFLTGLPHVPDLLVRTRATKMQKGMSREHRFENQAKAIALPARSVAKVAGKKITLIDDVLTTGATLSACADVLMASGARSVNILVLARVAQPE